MKQHVHVSDFRQFKNCRVKWWFTSPLRGGWAPKTTPKALHVGTLVHKAIELWYADRSKDAADVWPAVWLTEERRMAAENVYFSEEEADKLYSKCAAILDTFIKWARVNDNDYTLLYSEQSFEVPFMQQDEIFLAGRMDQVLQDKYGRIWIRDFKITTADMYDYSDYIRAQDDQVRAYVFAAKQLFPEFTVAGAIFTFVRAKEPTIPEVLKSGKGLTRKANIDTTFELYHQTIIDNGFDVADYEVELNDLKMRNRTKPWVMQTEVFLTDADLVKWLLRSRTTMRTMAKVSPDSHSLWPADYFSCKGCPFRRPCNLLLNESEERAVEYLRTNYIPGKYALDALDTLETE